MYDLRTLKKIKLNVYKLNAIKSKLHVTELIKIQTERKSINNNPNEC